MVSLDMFSTLKLQSLITHLLLFDVRSAPNDSIVDVSGGVKPSLTASEAKTWEQPPEDSNPPNHQFTPIAQPNGKFSRMNPRCTLLLSQKSQIENHPHRKRTQFKAPVRRRKSLKSQVW